MYLVDIHRLVVQRFFSAEIQPCFVVPLVVGDVPYTGSGVRPKLGEIGVGVSFHQGTAILGVDGEFVKVALMNLIGEAFPDAAPDHVERGRLIVPLVKITDEGNALSIGCPDTEPKTDSSIFFVRMTAQQLIGVIAVPVQETVQTGIEFGKIFVVDSKAPPKVNLEGHSPVSVVFEKMNALLCKLYNCFECKSSEIGSIAMKYKDNLSKAKLAKSD